MKKIVIVISLSFIVLFGKAQKYQVSSPDNKLKAEIEINKGITVKMLKGNETVFTLSGISIETANDNQLFSNLQVKKTSLNSVNEEIKPQIRDKSDYYKNNFNELNIAFKSSHSVTFRLFNEGLAYRLSTSVKDSLTIIKENLNIQFQEGDSARFQPAKSFNFDWESPYEFKKISELEAGKLNALPFLIQKQNGLFVMITESDLYNYPGLWLQGTGKSELTVTNPPFPRKLSYT